MSTMSKKNFPGFLFFLLLPEIHTTGNVKRSVTRDFFFFEFLFFSLLSSVPVSDDSGEKGERKVIRAAASIFFFFYLRNFSLGPGAEDIKIMMEILFCCCCCCVGDITDQRTRWTSWTIVRRMPNCRLHHLRWIRRLHLRQ
jgi:hypothetical protein